MRFAVVIQEEYPGSLESYKELCMLNARQMLTNFEELSESTTTIDGKTALLVFYRALSRNRTTCRWNFSPRSSLRATAIRR